MNEFKWSVKDENEWTLSLKNYKNKSFEFYHQNMPIIHIASPFKVGSQNGIMFITNIRVLIGDDTEFTKFTIQSICNVNTNDIHDIHDIF